MSSALDTYLLGIDALAEDAIEQDADAVPAFPEEVLPDGEQPDEEAPADEGVVDESQPEDEPQSEEDPFADAVPDDGGAGDEDPFAGGGGGGGAGYPPLTPAAPSMAAVLSSLAVRPPGWGSTTAPPPVPVPPPVDTTTAPRQQVTIPASTPRGAPVPSTPYKTEAPRGSVPAKKTETTRPKTGAAPRTSGTSGKLSSSARQHFVHGDEPKFTLKSEMPNVSDVAWTRFARAMQTAKVGDVSKSNALGMFELKPRRLEDLGLVMNLENQRGPVDPATGKARMIWVGEFVPPMTRARFLSNPVAQYRAFVASMKRFIDGMRAGTVPSPEGGRPRDMTLSGALSVLHRCGPSGMRTWNNEADRFPDTVALYDRCNGIF